MGRSPVDPRAAGKFQTKPERHCIAAQSHFDGLPRQRFRFTVKQGFGCQGGTISRPFGTATRIARLAFRKSALFPDIVPPLRCRRLSGAR
jgi:hypothetical protein